METSQWYYFICSVKGPCSGRVVGRGIHETHHHSKVPRTHEFDGDFLRPGDQYEQIYYHYVKFNEVLAVVRTSVLQATVVALVFVVIDGAPHFLAPVGVDALHEI